MCLPSVFHYIWVLTQCQKWDFASCLPLNIWSVSSFAGCFGWLLTRDSFCSLPSQQNWICNIFHCSILKMMQNGSKPKGKYLIIVLQTIKWWEISCDTFSEILMSMLGGVKTVEVMAGWQTVFISWLLVARQWPDSLWFILKSLHHQSDPDDYCEINCSSVVIPDVHNHRRAPAKTGHRKKKQEHYKHMHIQMHNYTHMHPPLIYRSAGLAVICQI